MKKIIIHHGDLRKMLIENGIELINSVGEEKLSMRKLAIKCGVSNAAPYAHFKDKDAFIFAIQEHIMKLFVQVLEETFAAYIDDASLLPMLGKTYVLFFMNIHNIMIFFFLVKI